MILAFLPRIMKTAVVHDISETTDKKKKKKL